MLDPARRLADRVGTNGYEQVAERIDRRSDGRWRDDREALVPFKQRLQPLLDEPGDSMD